LGVEGFSRLGHRCQPVPNFLSTRTELDGPANAGEMKRVAISFAEELAGEVAGAVARGNFLYPKLLEGFDDFLDLFLGHPSHVEAPDHKVDLVTRDFLRSFYYIFITPGWAQPVITRSPLGLCTTSACSLIPVPISPVDQTLGVISVGPCTSTTETP
jgi:hypothetical protein